MEKDRKNLPLSFLGDRLEFPPVETANEDGLLAVGGDLSPQRLLLAYKNGIFPWFNEDALILWWSPDPRMVLFPKKLRISKSMRKVIRKSDFILTQNACFDDVVEKCAKIKRKGQDGTWITNNMKSAYKELFELGFAKSFEVWKDNNLVGGLYGIDLGHVFCGESMFSTVANASKFAFIQLVAKLEKESYKLIDCQMHTDHLKSLGAETIPRDSFIKILKG
ncbi:leucyl/phenylalanyl-tRNA--protein transferase [Flagellimonas sp. HMM57]|uniref:leucyl/phenylalanyl-tRNA--protein transferase n=1 Tax=unclassified Flagellimonas TaxID=2644544 RepID=UPI001F0B48D8|nr:MULTISPECIES: leucyl/phenylalanyl-tRNA--protein transferase [unclassified Flagellimonas]UII74542.1 leucyl/phenylalanyl-tRNA--protein transferase [Flagellimonas sp. HMM57]